MRLNSQQASVEPNAFDLDASTSTFSPSLSAGSSRDRVSDLSDIEDILPRPTKQRTSKLYQHLPVRALAIPLARPNGARSPLAQIVESVAGPLSPAAADAVQVRPRPLPVIREASRACYWLDHTHDLAPNRESSGPRGLDTRFFSILKQVPDHLPSRCRMSHTGVHPFKLRTTAARLDRPLSGVRRVAPSPTAVAPAKAKANPPVGATRVRRQRSSSADGQREGSTTPAKGFVQPLANCPRPAQRRVYSVGSA